MRQFSIINQQLKEITELNPSLEDNKLMALKGLIGSIIKINYRIKEIEKYNIQLHHHDQVNKSYPKFIFQNNVENA